MRREGVAFVSLAALALFAAATCRTTRTIVAKIATPSPTPANPEVAVPAPARRPTLTATPLPVVPAEGHSIYDRAPGVLYEQTMPATLSPTPQRGTAQQPATRPPAATSQPVAAPAAGTPALRPTWTPPAPTATPSPTSTPVDRTPTAGVASPTRKPGAYYEPQDFRLAVTWTPTPEKRR